MRRQGRLAAAGLVGILTVGACGVEGASSDAESPAEDDTVDTQDGAGDEGGGTEDDPGSGAVPGTEQGAPVLTAALHDVDGDEVGSVTLTDTGGTTEIEVLVQDLPSGFHGLHLHAVGECEPDSAAPDDPQETGPFLSAGGHIGAQDSDHGEHPGDLPSLHIGEAGGGRLVTRTDALTVEDILDDDGSALMVHGDRDNFAHIPERYGDADEDTLATGDAGDRIACAVLE